MFVSSTVKYNLVFTDCPILNGIEERVKKKKKKQELVDTLCFPKQAAIVPKLKRAKEDEKEEKANNSLL